MLALNRSFLAYSMKRDTERERKRERGKAWREGEIRTNQEAATAIFRLPCLRINKAIMEKAFGD